MNEGIRLAVDLSDMHVGSTVGLWPNDFFSQEGNPIGRNKYQEWLGECWDDLNDIELPRYINGDPYALILNGDCIDGIHPRILQTMTHNVTDQMTAAKQVLGKLADNADKIFIVKGTEFHTRDREISLGEFLGAEVDEMTGQHAFDKLNIEIHGCPCIFKHHIGVAQRAYLEASMLSIELGNERIHAARCGHTIPKVMMCAHRHQHGIFKDTNGLVGITAGWQGLTRHCYKTVSGAQTSPSCIVLDWRNREYGDIPHAEDFIYIAEPPKPVVI